ncbi:MAG: hypothetical protein Q8Q73_16400 [Stagnimonas sp.]|nr:hypothetical protein [Stagnimonas sp.]
MNEDQKNEIDRALQLLRSKQKVFPTDEPVGLVPIVDDQCRSQLKHSLLLFDKIIPLFKTTKYRAKREIFPVPDSMVGVEADLDWLCEKGLVIAPRSLSYRDSETMEDMDPEKPVWIINKPDGHYFAVGHNRPSILREQGIVDPSPRPDFYYSMYFAERLKEEFDTTAFLSERQFDHGKSSSNEMVVLMAVLENIPIPDTDLPLEQLLDWRSDADAQLKLRRLKHWINTAASKKEVNSRHLKDEIRYLLDEYQQQMLLHDIKFRSGVLKAVITTTAEILENVAKLKIAKLSEMPFRISDERIQRLSVELQAPGRSLAYIAKAQDRFIGP